MGRLLLAAACCLSQGATLERAKGRVEGTVVDEQDNPVADASILAGGKTTRSDGKGAFALELEPGLSIIVIAKGGLAPGLFEETIEAGQVRRVHYKLARSEMNATVVGARLLPQLPVADPSATVGRTVLDRADIDRTPGSMEDISRVIATLPGVAADPDLLATFFVRGGGPDEVLQYLDGVPLKNPFHLGGFASVYNPMLIASAELHAGMSPARYEPALSGAFDVHYATGEAPRLHGEVDLSMQTAKARLETPTGIEGLSALVAFRRSFFELYFAGLRAAHVLSGDYVSPEIGEYFGRLFYKRGAHQVTATYLRATDGFSFLLRPGEKPLFGSTTGLSLSNLLQLGLLRDTISLGDSRELSLSASITNDSSATTISRELPSARDVARFEALARADLTLPLGGSNRLLTGVSLARRNYDFRGQLADDRGTPPWVSRPLVDAGQADLDLRPRARERSIAAYAELATRPLPALAIEGGARIQSSSSSPVYSLRAAAALTLPIGLVAKVEGGMSAQQTLNPLLLDPTYGNPALLPERSRSIVVGIEQGLPYRSFLRIEAFYKWLDHLVVNPDNDAGVQSLSAAGQPVFQNLGTGQARGFEVMLVGRTTHVAYGISNSVVFADRTNPLAAGVRTYATPWDQRETLSGHVSVTLPEGWLASARATFHTGRPYTPVAGFSRDDAHQRFLPIFGDTNGARYSLFFEASLRVEKRFVWSALSMEWYAEILNMTNAANLFALTYGNGDFAANTAPEEGRFNHLPVRPFLGIRGEY